MLTNQYYTTDMKKLIFTILFLTIILPLCKGDIWYISEGGRGKKDGTSWSNAASDFPDLLQNPSVNQNTVWSYQGLLLTKPSGMYFVVIQHDNIIMYSEKIVLNK